MQVINHELLEYDYMRSRMPRTDITDKRPVDLDEYFTKKQGFFKTLAVVIDLLNQRGSACVVIRCSSSLLHKHYSMLVQSTGLGPRSCGVKVRCTIGKQIRQADQIDVSGKGFDSGSWDVTKR